MSYEKMTLCESIMQHADNCADGHCAECDPNSTYAERVAIAAARVGHAWTTQPPTQPGWYWARVGSLQADTGSVMVVELTRTRQGLEIEVPGWDGGSCFAAFDLWVGPLAVPEVPK